MQQLLSLAIRRIVQASTPVLVLVFAATLLFGSACNRDRDRDGDRDRDKAAPDGKEPPSAVPQRIVSLSPSTTEAIFALGAGERLVGRSKFCDYPPEVVRLPSVGGYIDPSLEVVLSLQPDLVVGAQGPGGRAMADRLGEQGIETFFPRTNSRADIEAMLRRLGTRLGREDNAEAVVGGINVQVDTVARRLAAEGTQLPRVLLVFGTKPIVVAGPGSFAGEILTLAGAQNAMRESTAYPTIGMETLLALDPDVILDATMAASRDGGGIHRNEPGWRKLRAVRQGRLISIRDDAVLRPGPRVGDGLITIARALHPSLNLGTPPSKEERRPSP